MFIQRTTFLFLLEIGETLRDAVLVNIYLAAAVAKDLHGAQGEGNFDMETYRNLMAHDVKASSEVVKVSIAVAIQRCCITSSKIVAFHVVPGHAKVMFLILCSMTGIKDRTACKLIHDFLGKGQIFLRSALMGSSRGSDIVGFSTLTSVS